MMHLCGRAENWLISIDTLSGELLQQNPIEKGLKGELFSRVRLSTRSSRIPAFTVKDFLLALCASDNHKFVQKLADQILQAQMNFKSTNKDLLLSDPTLSTTCFNAALLCN